MVRIVLSLILFCPFVIAQKKAFSLRDSVQFQALKWRNVGPFRGGRSLAVAGHASQPLTFYFGATGGGVWKTTDGGNAWLNVSDGFFATSSVGALEVAPSEPNVIYAGTGESCIRGNISPGDGIYKSLDAGATWSHVGLSESHFISRIVVDPRNPDVVFVAALGQVFGTNKERGVYRSLDGGKNWQLVLYKDEKTGAIDVSIDPNNSRVVYAALWEAFRNPWSMSSGGAGSGLFKSTDGGSTWQDLSKRPGMPKGILGKIGVALSPAKPGRVWAIVEAEHGGVFRSDDGGETWDRVNDNRSLRQRAWYYSHIYADPLLENVVYVLNVQWHKSVDGGKTFQPMKSQHGDHHDLWIDPTNSNRMILADDGGAVVSYNGGESWSEQDVPTAQFYHVLVDNQFPYNLYGAQQDNSTIVIPSRTSSWGIDESDWHAVAGGESGYIAADPLNPDITYGGSYMGYLTRYDHRSKQERIINVWPDNTIGLGAGESRYRFQWTYPIILSTHRPGVLYVTSQFVHRSTDQGQTWETISPDLTRNEKGKQVSSGGPITKDNTGVEYYNTIFTLAESPLEEGVLWAGSDDGLIHVTRDNCRNWENVTPKDIPEGTLVSIITASSWAKGTAYVACTRYKLNDFKPMLFKTSDYGKSWTKINKGIPDDHYTRVIREDPNREGLLYAGTERGIYVSFDGGANWRSLQLNLPQTPIHDLVVQKRDKDLVVATHGRAFWILDDLTPLYQMDLSQRSEIRLYKPRDAYRMDGFQYAEPGLPLGTNAPNGVLVNFVLDQKPKEEVRLNFRYPSGRLIASYSSKKDKKGKEIKESEEFYEKPKESRMDVVPTDSGINRFIWDMRYADAKEIEGAILWGGSVRGPKVKPGSYVVDLVVGNRTFSQEFSILKDPRVETSEEDLGLQERVLLNINALVDTVHKVVLQTRTLRKQIDNYTGSLKDSAKARVVIEASKALTDTLRKIEETFIQSKLKSGQDVLNYGVKMNNRLTMLGSIIESSDSPPTASQTALLDELRSEIGGYLEMFRRVTSFEVPKLNARIDSMAVPTIGLGVSGD